MLCVCTFELFVDSVILETVRCESGVTCKHRE